MAKKGEKERESSSGSGREEMDVPTFAGEVSATAYLRVFELVAKSRTWDAPAQLLQLLRHLRGKALTWFGTLPEESFATWDAFRVEFVKKWDKPKYGDSIVMRIRSLRQRPGQSFEDYVDTSTSCAATGSSMFPAHW